MKTKRICTLFFSLFTLLSFAQKDSLKAKYRYDPNFMVGIDVLNAGIGVFSERKLFQGFVSSKIKKDIHAVADAGFERNVYKKSGYDGKASGFFAKLGAFYMLSKDSENDFNGFYGGGKLAGSFYRQEYPSVPVRGYQGSGVSVPFPASSQSSYWVEAIIGGRVQLFNSSFYIDVSLQPRYLMFSTKQEELNPMIVPGFGRSSGKFNMGFAWNLAYKF